MIIRQRYFLTNFHHRFLYGTGEAAGLNDLAAFQDGTVVLLVTVESSGVPSSVEIRTSSGHTLLDTAARDHLRRNWRWPSGESRLFIVPIKFVLQ